MFSLLCYIVLYYNFDNCIRHCYLPLFNNTNDDNISTNHYLFYSLNTTSLFMIGLYLYQLSYAFLYHKINKTSIALSYVYIKYLLDILINPTMSLIEYEMNRNMMWVFTTPLMLKLYCETNDLTLWDIKFYYHIISITPLIFLVPFKNDPYYYVYIEILHIPCILFMKSLYQHKHLPFTNMYLFIWIIFIIINHIYILFIIWRIHYVNLLVVL